jgi:hypothetical protein
LVQDNFHLYHPDFPRSNLRKTFAKISLNCKTYINLRDQ